MQVIECGWQGKDEVRPRDGILRVTAGHRIPGVCRSIAEVFQSSLAIRAGSVDAPDPGDPDTASGREFRRRTFYDFADDLMARNDSVALWTQFSFNDVQIGSTDAARAYLEQQFTGFWFGLGHFGDSKWMLVDAPRGTENCGFHVNLRTRAEITIVQVHYAQVAFSLRALLVRALQ